MCIGMFTVQQETSSTGVVVLDIQKWKNKSSWILSHVPSVLVVLVVDTADAFASETSRPSASSSNETHNVVSSAQDKVMSATLLEKTKLFRWRSKSIYSDDVA